MLDHLEELEDIGGVEGDTPKDKGIQAGSQGIDVGGAAPAEAKNQAQLRFPVRRAWGLYSTSLAPTMILQSQHDNLSRELITYRADMPSN